MSLVAVGSGGSPTVAVIVDETERPSESVTLYEMGVATPVKVGSGSNVTTPVIGFTV